MDYIASLGTRFGNGSSDEPVDSSEKRAALAEGFKVIAMHETALAHQFVSGLDGENAWRPVISPVLQFIRLQTAPT